jgi:hypothetical protein
MKFTYIFAIVTSGFLLMAALGVYFGWSYQYADGLYPKIPEETVERLSNMSDPEQLKGAALMLAKHQNERTKEINTILNKFIYAYSVMCVAAAVFIWVCTWTATKAYLKAKGVKLGRLKWL